MIVLQQVYPHWPHAYSGAWRHALTVGFEQMILQRDAVGAEAAEVKAEVQVIYQTIDDLHQAGLKVMEAVLHREGLEHK